MDPRKAYLKEMMGKRGYLLDYHKVLVAEDLPFLKALNGFLEAAYTDGRRLDRKTKEFILTAVLTAIGAEKSHIQTHMQAAMRAGGTKEELLELLELVAVPTGIPSFMRGYEAWKETVVVDRIEPD
ncbi:MAG: carboxymuconolactone decarboxylase family protein [Candidatus Methylomirabilales bacterium]